MNFAEAVLRLAAKKQKQQQRTNHLSAEHWFQRGLDLEKAGAPTDELKEAYLKALEFNQRHTGALLNIGAIYSNQRKWAEAQPYFLLALEADPEFAKAHRNLADTYEEMGNYDLAISHYEKAIQSDPDFAEAHFNIALLLGRYDQSMKAMYHWRRYLKLDSEGHWARIARRELNKLREQVTISRSRKQAS